MAAIESCVGATGARAAVDAPVARGDDLHGVFDDHDGVAGVDEAFELRQEALDVSRMR
jgi:hypothetical protein